MSLVKEKFALKLGGWVPDLPDHRDFGLQNSVHALANVLSEAKAIDTSSDLSHFFPLVEDQGATLATTAVSCGSLAEYFNRRCRGRLVTVSKWFLHDVTCRLHGIPKEGCVSIRQVLKTLVRVGVPPNTCVQTNDLELSLDPLLYSFSNDYDNITYIRVASYRDPYALGIVKKLLCLGLPCVFGMPLCAAVTCDPHIDSRPGMDEIIGGTCGVFVGHDDDYPLSTRGALRFRSTWGPGWGDDGYGWISYRLLQAGLVPDIWTIFSASWNEHGDLPFGDH